MDTVSRDNRAYWLRWLLSSIVGVWALVQVGCFSLSAVPPAPGLPDVAPAEVTADVRFIDGASDVVPSSWGRGFVLVRPILNGVDVGWFILDTGASSWTITADAARRAGLSAVGAASMQGTDRTTVYQCDLARLGALELRNLHLAGLDLHHSSSAFGRDVVGICGRQLCSAAVVEFDAAGSRLALHDPRTFDRANTAEDALVWHELTMIHGLPHIRCRYGSDAEGLFVLDTGCDVAASFFGSAVQRHDLLNDGVSLSGTLSRTSYGSTLRVHSGTIPRFEIDEQTFGPLQATFGMKDDPASRVLPEADGLIGMGLMRRYAIFLDEQFGRVAFVERVSER